jgi:hypothetical protein
LTGEGLKGGEMPGPVSDSYDPEFGTSANVADVVDEIETVIKLIESCLGPDLKYIVQVVQGENGDCFDLSFSEKELRTIRFALNRALETI